MPAGVRGGDALRFSLPDRRGEPFDLIDLLAHKVLLVFWASWCGCRYDLAVWEAEYRSLVPAGLRLVSIALDPDPGDAYEFIDAADATHVALIDAHAMSAARFDVINVPTVVWIDERGAIARPPDTQTATDAMRQFNGQGARRARSAPARARPPRRRRAPPGPGCAARSARRRDPQGHDARAGSNRSVRTTSTSVTSSPPPGSRSTGRCPIGIAADERALRPPARPRRHPGAAPDGAAPAGLASTRRSAL
jgi:peroxiredoxin